MSRGYDGMGVHRLSLAPDGKVEAKEYGTPSTHFAKRKLGPSVTALKVVLAASEMRQIHPVDPDVGFGDGKMMSAERGGGGY